MPAQLPVKGVIFDLGDVLFTWSPNTTTVISPKALRSFLSSPTWFQYECGHLSQDACYESISEEFSVEYSQVAEAFSQARASLQPHSQLVEVIKDLKKRPLLRVYAMSNVAKEDFAALADKMDWSLFDRVFTSGEAGMRKPNPDFYKHVLQEIELAPEQVLFVDDKEENVLAAESLGMDAFIFDRATLGNLQTILDDTVARGREYLYRNAKKFDSVTDSGIVVADNFAELLILEAMQDRYVS